MDSRDKTHRQFCARPWQVASELAADVLKVTA
jgi:hypothetical protein